MERIGKQVERELSQGGSRPALALAEITSAWPQAVGAAVARRAWPLRLGRDGTLHVATASATWAFELDRLASEISARLTAILGPDAPSGLRFRVGPIPEAGSPEPVGGEVPGPVFEVSPEASAEARSLASEIADPELRELVARAARASLSRPPQTERNASGPSSPEGH